LQLHSCVRVYKTEIILKNNVWLTSWAILGTKKVPSNQSVIFMSKKNIFHYLHHINKIRVKKPWKTLLFSIFTNFYSLKDMVGCTSVSGSGGGSRNPGTFATSSAPISENLEMENKKHPWATGLSEGKNMFS